MRTRPFLRSSEFLWQEGHTAHSSSEEALSYAKQQLDMYASLCQDLLAVPVMKVRRAREASGGPSWAFYRTFTSTRRSTCRLDGDVVLLVVVVVVVVGS